ncbi:hypothetical protein IIC68_02060 [archaeon]|nr:hypothetical protein [archaeon]
MGLITVFLSILIVSLLIGNGLLYLIAIPKRKTIQETDDAEMGSEVFQVTSSKSLVPLEKKVELAHKRIQKLEDLISKSKSVKNNLKLERKVEKLDNFRSTIESEIIGIKEILIELQNNHITIKSRSFKSKGKTKKLSPKQLHSLVYRSSA